jgi:uncharacterized repeat protein (TIGR03803 family)
MFQFTNIAGRSLVGLGMALAALVPFSGAQAAKFTVLHAFAGGSDGLSPSSGLLMDSAGNLYGTTAGGGSANEGVIYKITSAGVESVLYTFTCGADGGGPSGTLIADSAGNLYGTASECGAGNDGAIFKISPSGAETTIYAFTGGTDSGPGGGLVADASGNLYGKTYYGGSSGCGFGCGTVFEVTPGGVENVLHTFGGGTDGTGPSGPLLLDGAGNLYGTTVYGGTTGYGTLFKIAPGGAETVLYNFCSSSNCADGGVPEGGVIADGAGNFYGTTSLGGANCSGYMGCGTVFELNSAGTESVLYSFDGDFGGTENGWVPFAGLYKDASGNFYGTTASGGKGKCYTVNGCGVVFQLAPGGVETVLKVLTKGRGGAPYAGLIADQHGYLYGTTSTGGTYGYGSVIKIKE